MTNGLHSQRTCREVLCPRLPRLSGSELLNDVVRALGVEFVPADPQFGEQIDELTPPPLRQTNTLVDGRVEVPGGFGGRPPARGVMTASVVRASDGCGSRRTNFSSSSRSMTFVTVAGGMRKVLLIQLKVRADSGSVASQART